MYAFEAFTGLFRDTSAMPQDTIPLDTRDEAPRLLPEPVPHAPAQVRSGWSRRVQWFAAEFAVVVAGVLVALGVQAMYQAGGNRDREQAYLRQIVAELRATEAELSSEIAFAEGLVRRAQRAHAAFFLPDPPSADSVGAWWRFNHAAPKPVLGTLRAVTVTGDLRLVRSDSARAAIVWISERAGYYEAAMRKWENVIVGTDGAHAGIRARLALVSSVQTEGEFSLAADTADGGSLLADLAGRAGMPTRAREPAWVPTVEAYLNDPAAYAAVRLYLTGNVAHLDNMKRMLADVRSARAKIEGKHVP